ncbi:transcriptional regulator GlxA family with amidase domain [Bradyrhizobium sp. USDA 4449]
MTNSPLNAPQRTKRVVFLAYHDHQPLDLVGPLQVFALANREQASMAYDIMVAAEQAGPVRGASGPTLLVENGLDVLDGADTVLVPGGPGVTAASLNTTLINAIRRNIRTVRRLCSVCTGAFLLAEAGALDGRKATTHWQSCSELSRRYPDIEVHNSPIFVHDRGVWTSAGVTAGIDMALALVELDYGYDLAARISKNMVVYLRRPGGQAQFSEPLILQSHAQSGGYSPLIEAISSSLRKNWSIENLASAAGQSPRTFQRRFSAAMGRPAKAVVESIRVSRAKLLMETTKTRPSAIAYRCGFGSEEQMRRAFHRQLGLAPSSFRSFFGK